MTMRERIARAMADAGYYRPYDELPEYDRHNINIMIDAILAEMETPSDAVIGAMEDGYTWGSARSALTHMIRAIRYGK